MSFPNHPPPQSPPSQPFMGMPFFDGDVGGFWPQFPPNHPSFPFNHKRSDFHAQFENRPPFKRPRNSESNSLNVAPFPPTFNLRMNPPNLPGSKGTCHIFYKTRLCVKYSEGNCKNGEHCTFAHGQEDLREPPPNWQELVREKEKDGGPGNWKDDQRLIHKMKICKKFYNGEECPYGEKCNFLHERPNPSFPDEWLRFKTEITRQRESSAISIGTGGSSIGNNRIDADQPENNKLMNSNLDATRTKPVFWKTKLCSKWEITGQCPFGERCHFAHGQSELQVSTGPGRVDVEMAVNSGPIQTKPVDVPVIDSSPADAVVGAPVKEVEDPNISKWKLNKKINSIYADWIYDDLSLTIPHRFSSQAET